MALRRAASALAAVAREFYARGWVLGTSGNFSAVLGREPLRLAISASGVDKGALTARQFLEIDGEIRVRRGVGQPSDEARLHVAIAREGGAGAVLHTHSIWSTVLSDAFAAQGGIEIAGYEMLKGLAGVSTPEHRAWLPILENAQDRSALARIVGATLRRYPECRALLLRRHGLYAWGSDLAEARRHVEIFEFLLEVVGRSGR